MTIGAIKELIWKIDNTPGITEYNIDGISIWLIMRHDLYRYLLKKSGPATNNGSVPKLGDRVKAKLLSYLHQYQFFRHDPLTVKEQYEVVNFCSGGSAVYTDGCYTSRVSGFLNEIPELKTLHVIYPNKTKTPLQYCGTYCFIDPLQFKGQKWKPGINGKSRHESGSQVFFKKLKEVVNGSLSDEAIAEFASGMDHVENLIPQYQENIRQFFSTVKPRLVIIEDANYGGWQLIPLIRVAKDMQVLTAEIQHGIFDVAFQYGEWLLSDPALANHKTDYVLTFGPYFSNYIKSTSTNIGIGNYYLENKKPKTTKSNSREKKILFISQHDFTNPIIPVLEEALKQYDHPYKLIVRLHPSERGDTQRFQNLLKERNVQLSTDDDMYDLLMEADYVVGLYSTVLFECVYFKKIPFVFKNQFSDELVPPTLGKRFSSAAELTSLFQTGFEPSEAEGQRALFWNSDCVQAFKQFIASRLPALSLAVEKG